MSKKRRLSYKLKDDEALVIAPIIFWQGLIDLFNDLSNNAKDLEEKEVWAEGIAHIDHWVGKTSLNQDQEEQEEVRQ